MTQKLGSRTPVQEDALLTAAEKSSEESSGVSRNARGVSRRTVLAAGALGVAATAAPGFGTQTAPRRVALVGTGVRGASLWGRDLIKNYAGQVELVGLCDINPGRLEYVQGAIGAKCPTFTDFGTMIDDTQPEQVIVTTVDATHDQFIVEAMKRGCDVITEKPMTTDEQKCQAIIDAKESTGRDLVVTFNYRYSPHRLKLKEMIEGGRIGKLTSVDFHWYLDIYHGAAYFRRWHGREKHSGGLFVHKACHHFDLLNWWIDSDPETVYAQGDLEFYGSNNDFRHTNCRGCPHQNKCEFHYDITKSETNMNLYVRHEHHDGYLRDGCVWSKEIDIFDKMGAQIRYMNGVQVSYSCTTYSPYEGYRIAFNGTEGRLEAWIKERQPWEEPAQDEIRVTDNFGKTELIQIPHATGGHGGGDTRMQNRIFGVADEDDPFGQAAGLRDGAMSALTGIAARKSARSGQPVRIESLTSLKPSVKRL